MNTITTYLLVSAAASLLVQGLKQIQAKRGEWFSQIILIAVSLVGGGIYFFLQNHQEYWLKFLQILAGAELIYSFIISKLESRFTTTPPAA